MKTKVLTAMILLLSIGLMAETTLYGAFRIKTKPSGADVNLYDIDQYLCETPSPAYPVMMDEFMELREGIPGRPIMLLISKEGYVPLRKEIFVPFLYTDIETALKNPTVFKIKLDDDLDKYYASVCVYYHDRRPRPRPHYGEWYVSMRPWYPPGFGGYGDHHHGHHGQGPWVPPPPPGGGHGGGPGQGNNAGIADHANEIPPGIVLPPEGGVSYPNPPVADGITKPPNKPETAVISASPSTDTNSKPVKVEVITHSKSPAPPQVVAPSTPVVVKDEKPNATKEAPKIPRITISPETKPNLKPDKVADIVPDKKPEKDTDAKPEKQPEKKDEKKDEKSVEKKNK